jgi:hypothetical protein
VETKSLCVYEQRSLGFSPFLKISDLGLCGRSYVIAYARACRQGRFRSLLPVTSTAHPGPTVILTTRAVIIPTDVHPATFGPAFSPLPFSNLCYWARMLYSRVRSPIVLQVQELILDNQATGHRQKQRMTAPEAAGLCDVCYKAINDMGSSPSAR